MFQVTEVQYAVGAATEPWVLVISLGGAGYLCPHRGIARTNCTFTLFTLTQSQLCVSDM